MKYMEVKKRGWVKNAAIIFLTVMLILTFFSNTIRNRSLPEVAAQYTTSGTITARIRGSGVVRANESFEVKANQTRTVSEVPVRLGDTVDIGDVLIRMTGSVSAELEVAQEKLREDERKLEELLITFSRGDSAIADASRAVQNARNILTDAQHRMNSYNYSQAAYNAAVAANNSAQADARAATATANARAYDLSIAQAELAGLDSLILEGEYIDPDIYAAAVRKVTEAVYFSSVANAQAAAASAAAAATESELSRAESWLSARNAVRDAQASVDQANAFLTQLQANLNIDSSLEAIQLRELRREIDETRAEITRLERDGGSSEITALVGGVIKQVGISPGDQTTPDEILMVIEVVDRGYSLSVSVTTAQANRVNVGDQAEVDRGWYSWGDPITATLINIRNDPQNPATNRILHFSVTGDVESETHLNITMSQRSENYQVIVPNNAIRTDTNGTFVLVILSRSSPLGNRYIATRADVNVIASDDTHTAVSGGLSGWDFVITNSTAPIDPGMEVRLVDNP